VTADAERTDEATVGGAAGCLALTLLVLALAAAGAYDALHAVDPGKPCGRVEGDHCMVRRPARVVAVHPAGLSFRAVAEDGRHTLGVDQASDLPEVGERVILEKWGPTWVSFVHTSTGRRVHTADWELEDVGWGVGLAIAFGVVGALGLGASTYAFFTIVRRRGSS
jgi:hypothetical protein